MAPQDDMGHDENQGAESHPEHQPASGAGRSADAPLTIATDDPVITTPKTFNPDWAGDPDQTMSVKTSQIRGPNEALNPNFVMVPVAVERPRPGGSGHKGGEVDKSEEKSRRKESEEEVNDKRDEDEAKRDHDDSRERHDAQHANQAHGPSLTRTLLYAGVVALICGVVGAWGYSYFFGSKKQDDQKTSGKSSGSSKDSGSSSDSGSAQDSGSGSDSGSGQEKETRKNSTSAESPSAVEKLLRAEEAWMAAVKELKEARSGEKEARRSEEENKAVLSFLKQTLLSAGRPGNVSLSEVFWSGGQGKDVTLRSAVDRADTQAEEAFRERPLAEASVRELLGQAYLSLGDAPRAVKEYERAFALRQAMEGVNHADTAVSRNQLAVAYRLAGRVSNGGRLYDRDPDSPAYTSALGVRGAMLLNEKKPAEAELTLRECLNLRENNQPDDWSTFETKSLLGEALLDQGKSAEAEPMLLSGYEGLKLRERSIPAQERHRVTAALQRLVRLYKTLGQHDKETKWRMELEAAKAGTHAAASPPAH